MKNYILIIIAAFLLTGCSSTFYLVRHAERLDSSKDSVLSEAGQARANLLKDILIREGIDAVYATKYKRTQLTGKPLADALGKEVIIYGTDNTPQFVERMKKQKNKDYLIVGHSNTVPEMVLYFTGDTVHIGHGDYDNLFVVKMKKGIFGNNIKLEKRTF